MVIGRAGFGRFQNPLRKMKPLDIQTSSDHWPCDNPTRDVFQERTITMTRRCCFTVVLCVFILGLVLAGCSKITQANYDKIEMGMTYQEVVDIIGAPDEMQDVMGAKNCVWGKDSKVINIKFIGDKVVFHSAKGLS
jgi:hypothetical protein